MSGDSESSDDEESRERRSLKGSGGGGDSGRAGGGRVCLSSWQPRRAGEDIPLSPGEGPRLLTRRTMEEPMNLAPPNEEEEDDEMSSLELELGRMSQDSRGEGDWSDVRGLLNIR